jgi:hypothetical protein
MAKKPAPTITRLAAARIMCMPYDTTEPVRRALFKIAQRWLESLIPISAVPAGRMSRGKQHDA